MEILNKLVAKHGYDAVQSALKEVGKTLPQMKVVISQCYGGFGLSRAAEKWLAEKGLVFDDYGREIPRSNPLVVQCVEELGAKANTRFSSLCIVEVPVGAAYSVEEYDGFESISW